MKRHIAVLLLAFAAALCFAFALAGCNGNTGGKTAERQPHEHTYGALIPERPATCTLSGVEAHYYCAGCKKFFDVRKNEKTPEELKIKADPKAHNFGELVPQVNARCESAGVKAHFRCADCGKYFDYKKAEIRFEDLAIPVTGHSLGELVLQVNPQCETAGIKAHYRCKDCGMYFDDRMTETDLKMLVIPATGHNFGELVQKVGATCEESGVQAYYLCADCGKYFDENKTEREFKDLIIPAAGHNFGGLVQKTAAKCEETGVKAHYLCADCGKYFDENKTEREFEDLIIPATGHSLSDLVPKRHATCAEEGREAYRQCFDCGKYFDAGNAERSFDDLKIAVDPTAHIWDELIPLQPATCTDGGLKAHYFCEVCGKYFDDKKVETDYENLKISAKGHNLKEVPKTPATCTEEGREAYYLCADCGKYFNVDKIETAYEDLKIDIDPTAHNLGELVPQVDARCEVAGTKAYYRCADCGKYFDDKKVETDYENLNIPAKDHSYGELVPEQPATCTQEGLKAYYLCAECGKYFNVDKTETAYEDLKIGVNPGAHKWGADGMCEYCRKKKPPYDESADGTKIYFGEYPQSEVREIGLKVTLGLEASKGELPTSENAHGWTDYNYYIEGEAQSFMWYIDVEYQNNRYRGVYFTSYRPWQTAESSSAEKSYQDDNGYEVNTAYWFKYEPIEWRVLTRFNGSALLMSDIILDSREFYHSSEKRADGVTVYPNNYKESDIRAWLNGTFFNTAFAAEEKGVIQATKADNGASSTASADNNYACENTTDRILLLSYKDVISSEYGFGGDSAEYDGARLLKSTAYAKAQGVGLNKESGYEGFGWWWLRSPAGDKGGLANAVSGYGYCQDAYARRDVTQTCTGVVPVLRIKL